MIFILLFIMTAAVYFICRKLYQNFNTALLTPVFTSTVVIILFFSILNLSFETYEPVVDAVTTALGPATVALAVPVYRHRRIILKYSRPFIISLCTGSIAAVAVSFFSASLFYLSSELTSALLVKSSTVPIALELAALHNGDLTMTAVFVMITGLIGAMLGPKLLTLTGIADPVARGIAVGTIAHGIGTAHILNEGELQGAAAAASMACTGIFLSFFALLF